MLLLTTTAFLLAVSCAVNPVTGKKQLMFVSEAQEVSMGTEYDPQVLATFGEYQNERIGSFVQAIGDEMGKTSHRPGLKYHIKLLDTPVINAFAVPGGYIYLTRGILAQLNSEAELVSVIGHEMGHITARHSMSQMAKQQLGQVLLIGGMVASEKFRSMAETAMQGMQLLFLSFSRENEREADRLGVQYTSQIGYNAMEMAEFFKVLYKMNLASDHAGVPTFMSTHPDPGARYDSVKQKAAEWQGRLQRDSWKVNRDNFLSMVDGIVYGEDPRQGFVDGNVFYHPEMKFMFPFPAGWKLQNAPTQVNMAPSDGKALMIFTLAPQKTLQEAAQATISQLNLQLIENRNTTINGLPALITISRQESQDQSTGQKQVILVQSCFIQYETNFFVFHGVSSELDFPNYRNTFTTHMERFAKLTDPARLNVKPKRVAVKKVGRTTNLAEAFKALGVPQAQFAEMALLNNMELTDQVQAGKLVKIVQ